MLDLKKRYRKDSWMVSRKIAEEVILVPIRQNVADLQCIYTLNDVGARLWNLLDGGASMEDLVSAVTLEYEVEASQAEADVAGFLEQLESIKAIEQA